MGQYMPAHRRTRSRSSKPTTSLWKKILGLLLAMFAVMGVSVVAILALGESLFPLTENQQIVFYKSGNDGKTENIYFAFISPQQQLAEVWSLAADQQVEVLGDYGQYRLGALQQLLNLDHRSIAYRKAATSWAINQVVDGVVVYANPPITTKASLGEAVRSHLLNKSVGLAERIQFLRLFFFIQSLPPESTHLTAAQIDPSDIQAALAAYHSQSCAVATVNTTSAAGLASQLGTIIEQSGWRVVRVTDQAQTVAQSQVVASPDCLGQAQRLSQVLPTTVAVQDAADVLQQYRADIVILIGEDITQL